MRAFLAVMLAACGSESLVPAVPVVSGPATLELSDDGSTLTFARGDKTLLTMRGDAFAVGTVDDIESDDSFDPYWLYTDAVAPEGMQWRERDATARMRVVASTSDRLELALDYDGARGNVVITPGEPGAFRALLSGTATDGDAAFVRLRADADPEEAFYGMGEWGDTVMHRGTLRPMQMEVDLELESGNIENHVPVPLLIGTRGWGVFAKSDRPGVFDIARQSDTRIEVAYGTAEQTGDGLELHLFSADQPIDVLAEYFHVAGAPGLPAPWAYGPLLWRDENENQAQVLDDIAQIRDRKLPTSGVWFDRPYATGVETFDFDPVKFPDARAMLQSLHDAGLRYAVWHAPYTAPADNELDPAGVNHELATERGFFPPVTGVLLNNWGKPIDFTNPDAYAWWKENLLTYTRPLEDGGFGIEGFKLDYAEDVVLGLLGRRTPWQFADGSDERTMHHGYTLLYHQIHREVLPEAGGFMLTRTGRWGDQTKGMVVWPGDLNANFERFREPRGDTLSVGGLPTALAFGIGLSASGFPFYASDTGGYRQSPATNECWLRWVQANAVSSAMQVGDSSNQMPWELTADNGRNDHSIEVYQRYASLHLRLFPYAWTYAMAMATTGRPIVRPFGLAYPEHGAHPSDQFAFGDHLLAAPVIEAGATSREVAFPAGSWIQWWDGSEVQGGGTLEVVADLDTLPLYVRRGGIVPMLREGVQTLSPVTGTAIDSFANDAGALFVRIAPGPEATTFTTYDGAAITQQQTAGSIAVSFTPGKVFVNGAVFELIATAQPTSVRSGATALTMHASRAAFDAATDGWFWEPATGGTLWIKVGGAAALTVE